MGSDNSDEIWGPGILALIGIGVVVAIIGAIVEGFRIGWEAFTSSSLSSDNPLSVALWLFVAVTGGAALVQILKVRAQLSVRQREAAPLILMFGVLSVLFFAAAVPNLPSTGSKVEATMIAIFAAVLGIGSWEVRSIRRLGRYQTLTVLFLLTILITLGLYTRFAAHTDIAPFLFAFLFGMATRLTFLIFNGNLLTGIATMPQSSACGASGNPVASSSNRGSDDPLL